MTTDRQIEGQLSAHPLAELIREINNAGLSGALRLSHGRAKAVVYFDGGSLILAASNLRTYRLREVLSRSGIAAQVLKEIPETTSDEDLAVVLIKQGSITPAMLQKARSAQASDVLRVALLWTDGHWSFDRRVRIANDLRVAIEIERLLLECARLLPLTFIKSRIDVPDSAYSVIEVNDMISLSSAEAFTLSRIAEAGEAVQFATLSANGLPEEDCLRSVYALSLSGILLRSDYLPALGQSVAVTHNPSSPIAVNTPAACAPPQAAAPEKDVNDLFARLDQAQNHYEVLGVPRVATGDEIKDVYHDLARHFHPDRFHQSGSDLRSKVESAFARIAQAYEVLSDAKRRRDYDSTRAGKRTGKSGQPAEESRAATCFRMGNEALERHKVDDAIRLFAEAAMLEPRVARYRAHYGSALMRKSNSRRMAETELHAALALEPNNASFRVMLAELYEQLGLRRRAESEVNHALRADPTNKAARALLSSLKKK